MEFSVMKLIGINFVVSLIFCSFNDVFVSSWVYKMFMGIGWLLSDYHNKQDWAAKCPMVEFVLSSSVSATTGFAPFELNQGYMPQIRMPMSFDTTFKGVKHFALQVKWDLMAAHDAIITHHVQQTFHANKKHCASDIYHVGDHVYLLTQNLTLPKGRARKIVPKYIGPYKVVKAHNEASTVMLELPPALVA